MKKIALEEHFRHPGLPEYSTYPGAGVTDEMERRLADFADERLKAMDEAGVEKAILSHTVPGIETGRDIDKVVRDAKIINDYLAERVAQHPDRFGGFATLPTLSPNAAADEFERAVRQLGFHGALINGHTHGHYLDEDRYSVLWERAAALGRPVYLHPTNAFQVPQNYQDFPEFMGALWGWMSETATHVLRLIFSGLFDRYPSVQLIIGHGGETLPYLLWRFDSRYEWVWQRAKLKKLPSAYLRENIFITTSGLFSTAPLRCAVEQLGAERVLFSVDYPYESSKLAGDWLDSVELPPETLSMIARENAIRVLRLE